MIRVDQGIIVSDFYTILPSGTKTADVILHPPEGGRYILRGVPNGPELEADVRLRYRAFLASADLMERGETHADES